MVENFNSGSWSFFFVKNLIPVFLAQKFSLTLAHLCNVAELFTHWMVLKLFFHCKNFNSLRWLAPQHFLHQAVAHDFHVGVCVLVVVKLFDFQCLLDIGVLY